MGLHSGMEARGVCTVICTHVGSVTMYEWAALSVNDAHFPVSCAGCSFGVAGSVLGADRLVDTARARVTVGFCQFLPLAGVVAEAALGRNGATTGDCDRVGDVLCCGLSSPVGASFVCDDAISRRRLESRIWGILDSDSDTTLKSKSAGSIVESALGSPGVP